MTSVLISNDDGVEAEGIKRLAEIANSHFDEVFVFAPSSEASQIGHRVTTYEPLRFEERQPNWFAVDGTPADCVRVGLHHLQNNPPEWVWSGINHGGNLGRHDYYISGTLAAAREAAFFGIKSLGASHYLKSGMEVDWQIAGERFAQAFVEINDQTHQTGDFWAVNLPHTDESDVNFVFCPQEPKPLDAQFKVDPNDSNQLIYNGTYHDRPRSEGTDVAVCFGGDVAISRLSI